MGTFHTGDHRNESNDYQEVGYTMSAIKALYNIKLTLVTAISKEIPGDILEKGVWIRGSGIFAKGWEVLVKIILGGYGFVTLWMDCQMLHRK